MSTPRTTRSPWKILALILLAALAVRASVILAPPDDLFEKGRVPHEEMMRGIAAKEFLDGALLPVLDYQINHFWGGSLIVSLLAVPSYASFGPTIVALRLVSLVFSLSAIVLAFMLLDRFASRRAAWIGAVLMAATPPGYTLIGCTLYGTHVESNTLALGLALLYFAWRERGRGAWARTFCFGAAAGFALWFGYGLLIVLLVIAFFELVGDKLFLVRRRFAPWWAGFLIGFSPWIAYSATHGFKGMKVYESSLSKHFVIGLTQGTAVDIDARVRLSPGAKLFEFLTRDWPQSLWFTSHGPIDGVWLGRIVLLVLASFALIATAQLVPRLRSLSSALLAREPRPVALDVSGFAVVFLCFFAIAWAASDFSIGPRHWVQNFRYLMPPIPFLLLLGAIGSDQLMLRGPTWRVATIGALALLAVLSSAGTLERCAPSRLRSNLQTEGYKFEWLVRAIVLRIVGNPERIERVVERIEATRSPSEAEELYRAIVAGLSALAQRIDEDSAEDRERRVVYLATIEHLRERADPRYRSIFETSLASPAIQAPDETGSKK